MHGLSLNVLHSFCYILDLYDFDSHDGNTSEIEYFKKSSKPGTYPTSCPFWHIQKYTNFVKLEKIAFPVNILGTEN